VGPSCCACFRPEHHDHATACSLGSCSVVVLCVTEVAALAGKLLRVQLLINFNGLKLKGMSADAGGVDAMDWAEMLERMYMRWAADQNFSCSVSDRSVGEEAGIKGVELSIKGRWAYGYLKGRRGGVVVRLPASCDLTAMMASCCNRAIPAVGPIVRL